METFDSAYGFDEELAMGNWFDIGGIRVKLAYSNSPFVESKVKDLRDKKINILGRELTQEEHEEIGTEAFKTYVLLDWETDDDLSCDDENKDMVFGKYPKFIQDCILIASNNKNFRKN